MRTRLFVSLSVAAMALGSATSAFAADMTVDNSGDAGAVGGECTNPTTADCSLRQAIDAVGPGGIVTIPASIGTITVASELPVAQAMTIQGAGATTSVSGNDATRVFHVNSTTGGVTFKDLEITHGSLTSQTALNSGGAGIFDEAGNVTLDTVRVTNNTLALGDFGGGVVNAGGAGVMSRATLTVSNSVISGNTLTAATDITSSSKGGAGIYNRGSSMIIDKSVVSDNHLTMSGDGDIGGGGVFNGSPGLSPTIQDSRITGNTATLTLASGGTGGGGGVYDNGGAMAVFRSTVDHNTVSASAGANMGGGGIFENSGTVTVASSTVVANSLTSTGGSGNHRGGAGIFQNAPALMHLQDSTIAANVATNLPGGGALNNDATSPDLDNSILAGNTGTSGANCFTPSGSAPFTSSDYNLESANTCGLNQPQDKKNTNPKLGPLGDNGGRTPTVALLAGSPAVNTGKPSCFSQDQRSIVRPQGSGCDRGAYEVLVGSPVAITGTATGVTGKAATLLGTVSPHAANTSARFEYGTSTAYGHSTSPQLVGAGEGQAPVSRAATGLKPGTKYHYRLVATSSAGTAHGLDRTFTTPTKPKCTLKAVSQKIAKGKLKLRAKCDKAAALKLGGKAVVKPSKGASRKFNLGPVTGAARKGVPVVLILKVPKAVVTALSNGEKGSASFTLKATALGATGTAKTSIAQLKLGK